MPDSGDIARMRRIISRLKAAGITVREIPNWEQVGATWTRVPVGLIDHHDASTRKSGEWGALGVIANGRPGIPKPLSQFQVARCLDGVPKVAIIAAGRANHGGRGGPRGVVPVNSANSWLYGVEKANDGVGEPITAACHRATDALFWAILAETQDPDLLIGHKEWTPRKSDPVYSMDWRRGQVKKFAPAGAADEHEEEDMPMPLIVDDTEGDGIYAVAGDLSWKTRLASPAEVQSLLATGQYKKAALMGVTLDRIPDGTA